MRALLLLLLLTSCGSRQKEEPRVVEDPIQKRQVHPSGVIVYSDGSWEPVVFHHETKPTDRRP